MADFANIICGVRHDSVFGPLKFCLYLLPLSTNVRDFGVLFDQFLNFDDHITAICRSTHFYIRIICKLQICYRMMLDILLFMSIRLL